MTMIDHAHASNSRKQWVAPRVNRLLASEAEFNPVITTDAEGTS